MLWSTLSARGGHTIRDAHRIMSLELVRAIWPAVVRVSPSSMYAWCAADNKRASMTLAKIMGADAPVARQVAAVLGVACVQMG